MTNTHTRTHTHTHARTHYGTLLSHNKEIRPFMTCMKFEDIMLSELSQTERERERDTACSHVYVKSKNVELTEVESRIMVLWGKR